MPQSWGESAGSKKTVIQIDRTKAHNADDDESRTSDDLSVHKRRPRRIAVVLFERPIDDRYRR